MFKGCKVNVFVFFSADHRHSSHHIHRPLSKLPSEGRRKKGSKKRKKDKEHKSSHAAATGTIEEGEDEEEEEEEGAETTPAPSDSEKVKDVQVMIHFILSKSFCSKNILTDNILHSFTLIQKLGLKITGIFIYIIGRVCMCIKKNNILLWFLVTLIVHHTAAVTFNLLIIILIN